MTFTFNQCIYLLKSLYDEQKQDMPFSSMVEKSIVTQIAVILYRQWDLKRNKNEVSSMSQQMYDIKEYIDQHYIEDLNLNGLSEQFYLHPVTISKEFSRCIGPGAHYHASVARI